MKKWNLSTLKPQISSIRYFCSAYKREIVPFENPVSGKKPFVHIAMSKCLFSPEVPDTFIKGQKKERKIKNEKMVSKVVSHF